MLENIVVNIVSGIVVAVVLEWWRSRGDRVPGRLSTDSKAGRAESDASPASRVRDRAVPRMGFSIWRVLLAIVGGFVVSAMVAGILEGSGHPKIKFGEPVMLALFLACTLVSWIALSRFSGRVSSGQH